MKKRVLYLCIADILITITYAKLLHRTTDKSCDKGADVKPDVVAKDQNGAHYTYFNSKRTVRAVDDKVFKNVTNNTRGNKDKVLVKKPIPKFHEVDSDEDYQAKYKWAENIDSAEHEDEDFNINDYEFDVNHDEFASGRKPLEPRLKINFKRPRMRKAKGNQKADKATKPKLPRSLIQRKVSFPKKQAFKVIRNTAEKMREEDYDQEFSTSSRTPEETTRDKDDGEESDERDEVEDSKETVNTGYKRTVRSPWDLSIGSFVEKLGERTSNMMTKFLSHLPIFPQLPYAKKDEVVYLDEPVRNPLRGR